MEHFALHKLSKTHTSLLPKVSNSLCCGNPNSAVYFYHSDHLGSASWITNGSGTPVQHLQYMPYSEPFVNERTSSFEERFTFTRKERGSETGFSYFGARYYDSDLMTAWLSVDPLADKYPSLSPYAYCAWNPVRLVDPDGRMLDEWNVNIQTGEYILVGERGRNSGTDYYNIVDSYGGYHGTYIGSHSKDYSVTVSNGTDCYGNTFFDIKTQNMDFSPFHPGMGDNSFSEVPSSGQLSNSSDLWGNTKYATTAIGGFTGVQNVLIENLAASGSDVSKYLGKAASVYNSTIKGIGIAGTITTITASGKQFYDYYNNGGSSWFVGAKLTLDAGMSLVSNIGPIGATIGFTYSMIDVCTGGFGTNKELNKYMK